MADAAALTLTAEHIGIIRHALGIGGDGLGRSYRNYYVADPENRHCRGLEAAGFMRVGSTHSRSCGTVFHVTKEGMAAERAEREGA